LITRYGTIGAKVYNPINKIMTNKGCDNLGDPLNSKESVGKNNKKKGITPAMYQSVI
jgi:hypothetical protein